jgi:uncharacterized protein
MRSNPPSSAFSKPLVLALVAALAVFGCQRTLSERVLDDAGLLSPEERERIEAHHALLLADHDIDYRVVTARTEGDINQYASESYERLGVGRESEASRGLLLVVDPENDVVRLEVGYSLEGAFTDAFVAYVEQRQMVPFFKTGRVGDGILATTELIVQRAIDAKANLGFDSLAPRGSGGAGAVTGAAIGRGWDSEEPIELREYHAGDTPEDTLASYFQAMDLRDSRSGLPIYTEETQAVLEDFHITPAQMDGILGAYRSCSDEDTIIDGKLAVIRYPISDRTCSPWFFRKVDDGWRLDLATMSKVIVFGRNNAWHLAPRTEHPYGFAFEDWSFDGVGFPHEEPVVDHRVTGPTDQY